MTKPESLPLLLAGVKVPCPICHGFGPQSSMELVGIPGADPMYGCSNCSPKPDDPALATGLVYLFPDTVRLKCYTPHIHGLPYLDEYQLSCKREGCRGWTASLDGWVWWRAAHQLSNRPSDGTGELVFTLSLQIGSPPYVWAESGWGNSHHYSFMYDSSNVHTDPEAAFFQALYQAVDDISGRVWPDLVKKEDL